MTLFVVALLALSTFPALPPSLLLWSLVRSRLVKRPSWQTVIVTQQSQLRLSSSLVVTVCGSETRQKRRKSRKNAFHYEAVEEKN